jgi:SAM-dependent methyltransferase
MNTLPVLLHVGCGRSTKMHIKGFSDWHEIRLDADREVNPDIVDSIVGVNSVPTESVDAVFSSHSIEHVYPHEVPTTLQGFHRVLKEDGFLLVTCPDLHRVCEIVVNRGLHAIAYESPMGPIAPIDILYGHRDSIQTNPFMAHKCGFTAPSLAESLYGAGFPKVYGGQCGLDLWFMAFKTDQPQERVVELAKQFMP